jgi:ABC-type antimicrobial peptide transport system permease subunit
MYPLLLTILTALRALRRNIFRSALTCLGIVIAVAAVVAMVEIGDGSNVEIEKTIASIGAAVMVIFPSAANNGGINQGAGTAVSLTPEDCQVILRECPAVQNTAPIVHSWGQLVYGSKNWLPSSMLGSSPAYCDIHQWGFAEGTNFTDEDVANTNQVCVIGQTVADNLFDGESPVGKELRLKNVTLRVLGVLDRKGSNVFGGDQDDIIITPWTTMKYRVNGSGGTSGGQGNVAATVASTTGRLPVFPESATQIYPAAATTAAMDTPVNLRFSNVDWLLISARSLEQIPLAMEQITTVLRARHHLTPEEDEDFVIRDMTEIGKLFTSTSRLMAQLLMVVAGISLVVGGVGIMNIMMVSVTERTREIGLRMAVGAKGRDILRQFLIEAVVLCLIGGLAGVAIGRMCSEAVTTFMHWPIQPSAGAALAALGVSGAVGIIFGFYPAWKASRLDPIEALRYE